MLRVFTHRLPRALSLLAAVLWLWNATTSEVHHLVVKHVVCAEHGELSEVKSHGGAAVSEPGAHPSIVAADAEHPDHGCAGVLPTPDRAPAVLGAPRMHRAPLVVADPTCTPAAPRGPPLAYAPKTSPPLAIG